MKIFIIIAAKLQSLGEYALVTSEKAFDEKTKAENYLKAVPAVWEEKNSDGVYFRCERSVFEIEVE